MLKTENMLIQKTVKQTDRKTDRQAGRQTDRQTNTQTDRHTDTQIDTQTERQTDRQTEKRIPRGRARGGISKKGVAGVENMKVRDCVGITGREKGDKWVHYGLKLYVIDAFKLGTETFFP